MEATTTQPDALAVSAVRGGDTERYRELVERHERRVYALAWSRLGDPSLAEEATQETFIRAYRHLSVLGEGAKFASWVTAIARNVAINLGLRHRRELNKRERWSLEQVAPAGGLSDSSEPNELCPPETLRQTLAELPAVHRECLVMFYLEARSGAEAAAALGISEAAFRVRLHRARAALRERLEERLAESLTQLRPSASLIPAIMAGVLAAPSAKATGTGTALLGMLAKFTPFKWLLPLGGALIGILPSVVLMALASRAERRNFRDPQGFRAKGQRAMYRTIIVVVPLVVIPLVFGLSALRSKLGESSFNWLLAAFMVGCFAWAWRMLGVRNRFQRGMLVWYGILGGGMVLKAVGLISANAYIYFFIAASLWLTWIIRWRPTRMDNSLFFRALLGMLELPSSATPAAMPTARLAKSDLDRFGKLLADRHLFNALRWCPEGLLLRQTFVKLPWHTYQSAQFKAAQFKAALPFAARDSSNVLLQWNGDVTAQISEADARTQRVLKPEEAALRTKVETQVATAVTQAWQEFRAGNLAATDRALGEKLDAEIFHVPPARAASTRWLQITAALPAVLFTAMLIVGHYPQILKPFFTSHAKPISALPISEMQVRATLAQFGEGGITSSNAFRQLEDGWSHLEALPAKTWFSSNGWMVLREHLLTERFSRSGTAAQRVERLLGTPDLLRAVANGWFGPEDFGLTPEEVRRSILDASAAARRQWFAPQEVPVRNPDGTPADYTTLNIEELARRVQCLQHFGCLDAADGSAAIETLLKHQVLSEQLPAGRRPLPFPELLHGTFLTVGVDPVVDTYFALVVLEGFGALDRVDREACIAGMLRFDHGKGLFKSIKPKDGLVAFGGCSRDTFCVLESLRMLGALDRVKDLDRWQFWPKFRSKRSPDPTEAGNLTGSEIEAWVCQLRLERIMREWKANPQSPARSLLEP